MGVVAIESFDLYNGTQANIGLQAKWTPVNWFYGPGLTTGRFGGQCYTWGNEGSESGWPMPAAVGPTFSVGSAFRHNNLAAITAGTARSALRLTSGGFGASMLGWRPNPDGSISVWRMTSSTAGTLLGTTPAGVLISSNWHYIEFSGTLNTVTGAVTLKVDGVVQLTLGPGTAGTPLNTCGQAGSTTFDGIVIGSAGGIGNGNGVYFDDMYVLDTDVSLGERRIETVRPSADTAQKQWFPNTGTVNYNRVNATVAQSTNYVQSSTVGDYDLYDCVDLSGTPVNIDYVQITAFGQKTDAGARAIKLVADLSGTQLLSGDLALLSSISKLIYGMPTKPGGGAWSYGDVNLLKVGPKLSV
jgi:hypothetical protein